MKKEQRYYPMSFDKVPDIFIVKVNIPAELMFIQPFNLVEWCEENLEGAFYFDFSHAWFESDEDAVIFKLTWE